MTTPTRGGQRGTPIADLIQNPVTIYDANGQAWMPAGSPLPVMVPNVETRITDFPTFWNRQTPSTGKARDAGGVTFAQLRALAKQTHVRVVIETVKDRQSKVEWSYTLKPLPGETSRETQERAKDDPRIDSVEDFWLAPDREHDWTDWQRDLLEQLLVCDNLSLLRRDYEFAEARAVFFGEDRTEPWGVEIINGDTIFPLIDDTGRRPVPPGYAYEQWIKGLKTGQFTSDELMYCPRNISVDRLYSNGSPVEQLLFYINMIMRRDVTKLDFYTKGNMPAGFMPLPPDWTPQQVQQFTDWLNIALAGDQENRAKIWPVPGGTGKIDYAQKEILQDQFDDAWLRLVCFCFSIPVSSLVKEQTRATADTSKQQAQEEGEAVITKWIGQLKTKIIRKWFGWGDIIAVPKQQLELDAQKRNSIDDMQLKNGTLQIDEVREREGRDPFGLEPGIVTSTGWVPLVPPTPDPAQDPTQQKPGDGPQKGGPVPFELGKAAPTVNVTWQVILQAILRDDQKLQDLVKSFHKEGLGLGAEQIVELLGEAGPIALTDAAITDFLRTRANKIVSVNQTTGDLILTAIRNGVAAGDTPEQIESAIGDAYDLRSAQAETIARTEVGSALNAGRYLQMEEEDTSQHEWLTSHDNRVRESHQEIDGEVVPFGDEFSNGLLYPQDPNGEPSAVINCRCITLPVFTKIAKKATDRAGHWTDSMKAAARIEKKMTKTLGIYFDTQRDNVILIFKALRIAA